MSDNLYTQEEGVAFLRGRPDLAYASRHRIELEMGIDDANRSLELASRYLALLTLILDPEADDEYKIIAAEMIYLQGYLDRAHGVGLP
jgi:hypothetical protein